VAREFADLVQGKWDEMKCVCVGLDSDVRLLPPVLGDDDLNGGKQFRFNRAIIEATADLVCAYKPNSAFYEACGSRGIEDLQRTIEFIHEMAPEVPVIVDAKRADIGNTNRAYADYLFEYLNADAITVHPYLGRTTLDPFLERREKGIFVLCRTSNPGGGELQDLVVGPTGRPLFQVVAESVATQWNENQNCGLVVGATYPGELTMVRDIAPDLPLLVPGVGEQGGDLEDSVRRGRRRGGIGTVVNASRSVIFRSRGVDFAEEAALEVSAMNKRVVACLRAA